MRSRAVLLLSILLLQTACCSLTRYEDLRHERDDLRAENARLLQYIAGAHDDNAMLQKGLIEQEMYVRQLEGGMMLQAKQFSDLAEGCDL